MTTLTAERFTTGNEILDMELPLLTEGVGFNLLVEKQNVVTTYRRLRIDLLQQIGIAIYCKLILRVRKVCK